MEALKILNWNVGGAKYLELKSKKPRPHSPGQEFECREEYREAFNHALRGLLREQGRPHVVCLQEIVQYDESGRSAPRHRKQIIDSIEGYTYYPRTLIDTEQFGAGAKWVKVMANGGWGHDPQPFFAQGNAFLVRDDCQYFPMWSLPKRDVTRATYPACIDAQRRLRSGIERVDLHPGLYFGDRNTEPRAAFVLHLVLWPEEGGVLDVFVVNLHLTTLKGEREGIPDVDEKASEIRLNQLKVVIDNCVSQYNSWRGNGYKLRENLGHLNARLDTTERHNPVWVLAGDFNFTRESAEYVYLTRRNFVDIVAPDPTKAAGLGKDPTIALDYVFAGPRYYSVKPRPSEDDLRWNKVVVNEELRVSDHYPIVATVPIVLSEVRTERKRESTAPAAATKVRSSRRPQGNHRRKRGLKR
jgi:endonuclease/exonuclease/phosphatase family metal-dependent hydrolase